MIQIDPLDFNSNFECLSCKAKDSSQRIETLIQDYCGNVEKSSKKKNHGINFLSVLADADKPN